MIVITASLCRSHLQMIQVARREGSNGDARACSLAMLRTIKSLLLLMLLAASSLSLPAGPLQAAQDSCREIKEHGLHPSVPPAAAQLCSLIEAGRLDELRWPDCSSYRAQVEKFYASNAFVLGWVQEGRPTPQAAAMIELFRAAEKKGLEPEDYDASRWTTRLQNLSISGQTSQDVARFDFALTVSALRYISDLSQGRVAPTECQVNLPKKQFDGAAFLRNEVIHAADVRAGVEKIEPPYDAYRRTLAAFEWYLALARQGDGAALPAIRASLRPGEPYAGVQQLAERLRQLGDLASGAAIPAAAIYQEPLVTALKRFQDRHGLLADGIIGRATFEELNVPLSRRVTQLKLALERWRWLPNNSGRQALVVNIPEFRLRAFDNQHVAFSMRAIVGQALEHQTPIFADEMEAIIFRPYWNVPPSIQREELVPILRRNPGYLAKHKMEVVNAKDEIVSIPAVDAKVLGQLTSGGLRIRQQPGPANSLGLIKFVFPNQYGVYMHGTPQRELFYEDRRDFSHGCIRIEDPAALAGWVLRDRPEWTQKRILAAMGGKQPVSVRLTAPIPVLILYTTAVIEENGEVRFLRDIYGNDAALEKALAARRH